MVFGAVAEPLASCVVVEFSVYVPKRKLVCTFDLVERYFSIDF